MQSTTIFISGIVGVFLGMGALYCSVRFNAYIASIIEKKEGEVNK